MKKRDQILKKSSLGDISKQFAELQELSYKYDGLKVIGENKKEYMKSLIKDFAVSIKDDIRRTLVHFISLMKNIEYDVNSEIEVIFFELEIRQG